MPKLLLDRRHHLGMAMPGIEDRDPAGKIDQAPAFDIDDLGVRSAIGIDRALKRPPSSTALIQKLYVASSCPTIQTKFKCFTSRPIAGHRSFGLRTPAKIALARSIYGPAFPVFLGGGLGPSPMPIVSVTSRFPVTPSQLADCLGFWPIPIRHTVRGVTDRSVTTSSEKRGVTDRKGPETRTFLRVVTV